MKNKIIKLKNGGTLIYSRSRLNKCSAVEVGFRVGANNDKKMGTAHFLEHTLFKKTASRNNTEVERDRNKIAFLNASTGMDYLIVKFFRTNKLIEKTMAFASDILTNSVLDDEYMDSEKGVIKEELKMCIDDESRDVYLKNYKQAISNPKFSSDIVGGTEENIGDIEFSDLKNFKNKHFIGNNFLCSVVTSLPLWKTKKLVNNYFVKNIPFKAGYKKKKSYYDTTTVDQKSSMQIVEKDQEKSSVLISIRIDVNEMDIFAKNYNYTFLSRYLSGSQGELFLKLRNSGLIYRLGTDITSFKDCSLFNIVFETSREKIKPTLEIIIDEINSVLSKDISIELIDEYRKNLEYYADEKMPTRTSIVCHTHLMDYMCYGKLFKLTKKQKKALRNGVTPEGVRKVANFIFNKKNEIFVTVLGNAKDKDVPNVEYFKEKFLIAEWLWKRKI